MTGSSLEPAGGRAELEALLSAIIERPDDEAALTRRIEDRFGRDAAVLALDMSGFSRTTQRRGIVAFLLMIQQMRLLARPAIEAAGGIIVKAEADNLMCLFDAVPAAVGAARAILERLDAANLVLPDERRIHASMGIGWGRVLHVGDDMWGDEVNLACKLGEDVAGHGEILLTPRAAAAPDAAELPSVAETVSISGLTLEYRRLLASDPPRD